MSTESLFWTIWGIGAVVLWVPIIYITPRLFVQKKLSQGDSEDWFWSISLGTVGTIFWPVVLVVILLWMVLRLCKRAGLGSKLDTVLDHVIPVQDE